MRTVVVALTHTTHLLLYDMTWVQTVPSRAVARQTEDQGSRCTCARRASSAAAASSSAALASAAASSPAFFTGFLRPYTTFLLAGLSPASPGKSER